MAKNQINFTKITEEARTQLDTFKKSAYAIAEEDLRFKAETKPLKAKLETILANRDNDIKQGMSVEEVAEKFPRTEVDNEIRKADVTINIPQYSLDEGESFLSADCPELIAAMVENGYLVIVDEIKVNYGTYKVGKFTQKFIDEFEKVE